jgi:signal transduction histidine kinase
MEKETSCINTKAIFEYVKAHNQGDTSGLLGQLHPEIDALPDPESFFMDPHNWVSCALISKLYKRAKSALNDEMAPYKMAKYAVENAALGYIQKIFVKAFWSTKKGLKHVQEINDKFNRNKKVELVEIKRNEAIVRLHWFPHVDASRDICLYNQGVYTFIPMIWGGKPITLKEQSCYFEGAPYCEYHLKWTIKHILHEVFSRFFTSKSVLIETMKEMDEDKKVIEDKYEEVNRLNLELNQKIQQLLAIQETGKAILSVLELDKLLTVIMNHLSNVCQINRALITLVNEEERCLEYIHGVGFDGEVPEDVKNYRVPLGHVNNILVRVTNTGRSEYVPDVGSSSLRKDNVLLTYGKPSSIYVAPLITRSKVIGVLATDAVDKGGVPEETRKILEIFAPLIAIAIENATLYSRLQKQMMELKRSHALLSRTEKFSFLGNLAARLAHEIKNPMTAIGTFIQLLPQKYDDDEFRDEFHRIAMEETTRVNNLITELLDLVKTRESQFGFNDLHDLIEKMILLVSPQSNAKMIEVVRRFDTDIGEVWMDSEKMKQVILNLLSNAIEFTPGGGMIEVSTTKWVEKGEQNSIRIEIKDKVVGIPHPMIDKVFDPYFTTKHKSTMHSGTGLGLFIAYQNMLDHGGIIEVKSTVNEGTTFILNLPAQPSEGLSP